MATEMGGCCKKDRALWDDPLAAVQRYMKEYVCGDVTGPKQERLAERLLLEASAQFVEPEHALIGDSLQLVRMLFDMRKSHLLPLHRSIDPKALKPPKLGTDPKDEALLEEWIESFKAYRDIVLAANQDKPEGTLR